MMKILIAVSVTLALFALFFLFAFETSTQFTLYKIESILYTLVTSIGSPDSPY